MNIKRILCFVFGMLLILGTVSAAFGAEPNGKVLMQQELGASFGELELSGELSIQGQAYVGGALTAIYSGDETVTYQWYREDEPIEGAAEAGYTVDISDIESELKVAVFADGYGSKTASAGRVPNYVAFDVQPEEAAVTVTDSANKEWPGEEGFYALPVGDYTYKVSAQGEYEEVLGGFSVPYTDNYGMISVILPVKTYDISFAVTPSDAVITLQKDGEEVEPITAGTKQYRLPKGDYTYSVSAFGYESKTEETFSVSGAETKSIVLDKLEWYDTAISIAKEAGGPDTEPIVVVRDSSGIARSYEQGLPTGDYTYSVSCGGYQSIKGSFSVEDRAVSVQETLSLQRAWDGATVTEPNRDADDAYLIGSPAELCWFAANGALDADARLIGDITLNEDMSADETELCQWTPMGTSSKKYAGSFDGGGYTVSGVYVRHEANGAGFFGYIDTSAEISNLTVDGKIIGTKNYTGGIVGDCYGRVTNCHNLAQIQGHQYVGGVVGDLENKTGSPSSMKNCSNRGDVTASGHTAGGVVGRIDSASASAVKGCYNTGSVRGTTKVGGVVGDQYAFGSGICDVYNVGSVTADTGYAGGILGNFRSGKLENAYEAAEIIGGNDAAKGKIVGVLEAAGQQKSFFHVYYLAQPAFGAVANLNGCTVQSGEAEGRTQEQLQQSAADLGDAFGEDQTNSNGGYPVLKWQTGEETSQDAPESDPNGWDGTSVSQPALEEGIYQISSAEELAWFAAQLRSYPDLNGCLIADIDLNNRPWSPMCGGAEDSAYRGRFDGRNYEIKGLYLSSGKSAAALFAGNAGTISGLTVSGQVNGADNTAAIAAYNYGTIEQCHSEAVVRGGNFVGGITAVNGGTVTGCSNEGRIEGAKYVGGIAGANQEGGLITRCFHRGLAESNSDFSGGVCAANEGEVTDCYNAGIVIAHAASLRSYAGGVVGWNNHHVANLYHRGAVISMGSYAGGTVGISTSGTTAENLYGTGSVMGMYYEDDEGYERYYVGAVAGRKTDDITNAYYLDSLAVTGGGLAKSEGEMKERDFPAQLGDGFAWDEAGLNEGFPILAWQGADNTPPSLPSVTGTVTISGENKVGGTLTADYTGSIDDPLFVWYTADQEGEYVLSIGGSTYQVPVEQAGKLICVKVFSEGYQGFVSGQASEKIEGMSGSVTISGAAIAGKTLTASYSCEEEEPVFQWYRGGIAILGATNSSYTVTDEDVGYLLKVRVSGNRAGYVEKAMTAKTVTAEEAGVWPDADCEEPVNVDGVYVLTSQKELCWFASEVNSGNASLCAKLGNDLTLTQEDWYPIGSASAPYTGKFDGNGKVISGLKIVGSDQAEQGFFGAIGGNGEVRNLTVSGTVAVSGEGAVSIGGIAGTAEGRILGCTFEGSVSGHSQVGGIVGCIGSQGMVTQCRNRADLKGSRQIGGIAGANSYGNIYYCVNQGSIGDDDASCVGGIAGDTQNYAVIIGCYNTGAVTGSSDVGGISGKVSAASAPQGCYNIGPVTGERNTGGVLGSMSGTDYISTVRGSFYLNTLPKDATAGARSEASMKDASFVRALNSEALTECYIADKGTNNGYPILTWEMGETGESGESSGGGGSVSSKKITVSFTLLGDTVHGEAAHSGGTVTWIGKQTVSGLPHTTTAFDLFRQVLDQKGYTYNAKGNGYVASITSPAGVCLGEFSNGPYSGWMFTVNGKFTDSMAVVTLKDGDDMVFFYVDDYLTIDWGSGEEQPEKNTGTGTGGGGSGNQNTAASVMDLINAIGTVTKDSGDKIEAARLAYDQLSDAQKKLVSNYEVLTAAEITFAQLKEEDSELPFTDVEGHWALDSIRYAYEKGLMYGTDQMTFSPETDVSRGMMVTILYRMAGSPEVAAHGYFGDVSPHAYYYDAIAWAGEKGIARGLGDGAFAPDDPVSREQMVSFLYRFAELWGYETDSQGTLDAFTDCGEISDWAIAAMRWACGEGIISGTTETTISPKDTATRAQIAAVLMRFCENLEKE